MGTFFLIAEYEKLQKKYKLALEYLVDSDLVMNVNEGRVSPLNEEEWDEYLEKELGEGTIRND